MATIESRTVFVGVNIDDSNDRVVLLAGDERTAKVELLDQLGYEIVERLGDFFISDVEDPDAAPVRVKGAMSYLAALDFALTVNRWKLGEPIELIGGDMPSGMGYDDEQNGW